MRGRRPVILCFATIVPWLVCNGTSLVHAFAFSGVNRAPTVARRTWSGNGEFLTTSTARFALERHAIAIQEREKQAEERSRQVAFGWCLPWLLGASAFTFYKETAVGFRHIIDKAAHHTWAPADDGVFQAELIIPALNGPVVTSISILFATMAAITISSLYTRQDILHRTIVAMVEDVLHLQLLVDAFPEPYKTKSREVLGTFADHIYDLCIYGDLCPRAIRKEHLGALVSLVNQVGVSEKGHEVRDAILIESYESIVRINAHRATLSSTLSSTFPFFHYLNLVALALSICFIFLLETDLDVVLFLAGFQLGTCWAMLVGTFSMLAMVCYDMATPFAGIFQIIDTSDLEELDGIRAYAIPD